LRFFNLSKKINTMNVIKTTAIASALLTVTACDQPVDTKQQFIERQLAEFILPLHQQFTDQSQLFITSSQQFCQQPNQQQLLLVQQQWLATMQAWQQLQSINFGPITVDNQAWKMQFWPDKKNLIKQKTLKLLRTDDTIDVHKIEHSSVVVQGLSAAEYLLFDEQQLADDETILSSYDNGSKMASRRCDLLTAISQHSLNIAGFLQQQWGSNAEGYGAVYSQPNIDNIAYPDQDQAITSIIQSIVSSLEVIQKNKLGGPLGYNNKKSIPRPYLAEAWRSQQSLSLIKANLTAAELFLTNPNSGLFLLMADSQQASSLIPLVKQQLHDTQAALAAIEQPLAKAVSDPADIERVITLYSENQTLLRLLKTDVVTALGLTLGFNSNDGD
jgi:hypothetical protein